VPLWERAVKWARRKPTIAALLAAVFVVTALGFAGVTWQWGRAEAGRRTANDEQWKAERARDAERAMREQVEKNLYFQRVARAHLEWLNNNLARADQLLDECSVRHRGWEWRYLRRLFHPETATLRGHALPARKVAFSPDGRLLASSDALWNRRDPGTVIVWDAHTGQMRQSFVARSGGFFGVAFSPDGERLAAANVLQGITVWNLATGREELKLSDIGHIGVAYDPTGNVLAGGDLVGVVRIWDARTGVLRHKLSGPNGNVFSIAFSPDGKLLASTARDGTVRIWDVDSGNQVQVLRGAGGRCVAFSPDGRYLASCGYAGADAGVVKVWKAGDEWSEILVQRVHDGPVTSIAISPDGRFLALNTANQAVVHLWEFETGRQQRLLHVHPPAQGLAFSPDGRTLASCGMNGAVKLWDVTREPTVILRPDGAYAASLAFRPRAPNMEVWSRQLAVAGGFNHATGRGTKTAQIWDVSDAYHFSLEQTLDGHGEWLTSVVYNADGERLATADRGGSIRIWDAASGRHLVTIVGPNSSVTSVAFSPGGERLVSGGADKRVRIWDSNTGQLIRSLEGHEGLVHQVAFTPDGSVIASAGEDQTVRLWDAATGQALRIFRGHKAAVRGIAFDSQGGLLATCSGDGLVHLWDVRATKKGAVESMAADRPLRTFRGHTEAVTAVSFSTDGTRLASISDDATVKVWDVPTGHEALALAPIGSGYASLVVFSSDGNALAAALGRYVTLWDASVLSSDAMDPRGKESLRRARDWHEGQIAACREEKHWFGEIFHLSQLIALEPDRPQYYYRRANAYALWARFADGGRGRELVEKYLADVQSAVLLSGGRLFSGEVDP
jgi:WD40 repeat protein